jgi:WD40 repeat protein
VSADSEAPHQFPPNTFLTYSSDGSIKFWNLDETCSLLPPTTTDDSEQAAEQSHGEVLRVLYADENCKSFIQAPENQGIWHFLMHKQEWSGVLDLLLMTSVIIDGMEPGFNLVPLECGVRTIRISHDGRYLASGDKAGNLRYALLVFTADRVFGL